MKLNPVEYINLIQREVSVVSSTSTRIYIEFVGQPFRLYNGKQMNFIFDGVQYPCTYKTHESDAKIILYYLEVAENSITVVHDDILLVFESFQILKDNQVVTYQDIQEYLKANGSKFKGFNSLPILTESGKPGLITDLDKGKLNQTGILIKNEQQISIDDTYTNLLTFKIVDLITNVYRIQLFNSIDFIDCTIQYDITTDAIIFINNNCSLIDTHAIIFTFKKLTLGGEPDSYVKIYIKNSLIPASAIDYNFNFGTSDITTIGEPILTFSENTILVNTDKTEISVDRYLLSFNKLTATILLNPTVVAGLGALSEAVTAIGVMSDLGVPDGTTYAKDLTFTEWLKLFVRKVIHPTYYVPTLSASINKAATIEVGSLVDVTLTATFTQNDAGAITAYEYYKNNVFQSSILTNSKLFSFELLQETISLKVTAQYGIGQIKNNNIGEPDVIGRIAAGSLSQTKTIMGDFLIFGGKRLDTPVIIDSDMIRSNNELGLTKFQATTSTFTMDISNGKFVWLAIPPGKSLNTTLTKNPATNEAIFAGIDPETINVKCNDNDNSVHPYKFYKLITVVAWSPGTSISVVIQ